MTDWKETGIGRIPKTWNTEIIENLIQEKGISVGVMYPGNNIPNGVPLIRAGDVRNNKIDDSINYRISEEVNQNHKRTILHGGELLVVLVGSPGISAIVPENKKGWNAARAIGVLKLRDTSDGKFIQYALRHPNVQHNLLSSCNTSVQATLNLKELKEVALPWPSKSDRDRIAEILSSLDDKIDLLHRQNKTLEQLPETLFRQWFVEEAEENWDEVFLGEFVSVKHGYAFKGNYISTEPTNLILVTPGNFKIGGGFKFNKFKYYTNEEFPEDYIFRTGDLVVTMTDLSVHGDTLGYPALIPESHSNELYLHNQRIGKVEFKKEISKQFIYQLMKTRDYQWFILGGASGTSIRHTSPTSICSYSFPMPPKRKIFDFECFTIELEEKIRINQNQIKTLTQLRDTLLPKLMSGEVRVEMN